MFQRKKIEDVCSRETKYSVRCTATVGCLPMYAFASMHIKNDMNAPNILTFSLSYKENETIDFQIDFTSSGEYEKFVKYCSPELKKLITVMPHSLAEDMRTSSGIDYNPNNLNLHSRTIKIPNNKKQIELFEDVLMMIHKIDQFDLHIINKIQKHFEFIQPGIILNRLKSEISEPYNIGAAMGLFCVLKQPIDPAPEVGKRLDIKSGANLAMSSKLFAKTASDASMLDVNEARKKMSNS